MERLTDHQGGNPPQRSNANFFSLPFSKKLPRRPWEPYTPSSHLRPPVTTHHPRRLTDDTKLGVFGAERYFNEGSGGQGTGPARRQKKGHLYGLPTTPTAPSETGWRSQLLSLSGSPAGSSAVTAKESVSRQRRGTASPESSWPFGGTCPCTRHKAVDVEEVYPIPRSSKHIDFNGIGSVSLKKSREAKAAEEETETYVGPAVIGGHDKGEDPADDGLASAVENMVKLSLVAESWIHAQEPFLGSSDRALRYERFQFGMPFSEAVRTVALPVKTCLNTPDEQSRFSLEVFQPSLDGSPKPSVSAESRRPPTRLMSFPGDIGPPRRSSNCSASPVARVVASMEDELASDSSSDLFEIESFSTQATPSRPVHRRASSPVGMAITPRSSRVSHHPRRAVDGCPGPGCEETKPEREQQQDNVKHDRVPATSTTTADWPPPVSSTHGPSSPCEAGAKAT